MKTKEERNTIPRKAEALNEKLAALTDDELARISGGDWGAEKDPASAIRDWESSDGKTSGLIPGGGTAAEWGAFAPEGESPLMS